MLYGKILMHPLSIVNYVYYSFVPQLLKFRRKIYLKNKTINIFATP